MGRQSKKLLLASSEAFTKVGISAPDWEPVQKLDDSVPDREPLLKLDAPAPKREPLQKLGEAERIERTERPDRMQSAQILRNEAYIEVRRNKPAPLKSGEGCSATQQMDFLRSRQD